MALVQKQHTTLVPHAVKCSIVGIPPTEQVAQHPTIVGLWRKLNAAIHQWRTVRIRGREISDERGGNVLSDAGGIVSGVLQ